MDTKEASTIVARNIINRGYYRDLTPMQLVVRNIVKMTEEVCELASHIDGCHEGSKLDTFKKMAKIMGEMSSMAFDDIDKFQDANIKVNNVAETAIEMADVQVVLLNMDYILRELVAKELPDVAFLFDDVCVRAVAKSTADIRRGVRGVEPNPVAIPWKTLKEGK